MDKRVLGFLALTLFGCGDGPADEGTTTTETNGGAGGTTSAGNTGGAGAEAETEGVTVAVVNQDSYPLSGIPVTVNDETGKFVAETWTDGAGKAAVHVPAGGSVSAFHAQLERFDVQTVVAPPAGGTVAVHFNVVHAAPASPENVTSYDITPAFYPAQTAKLVGALDGCTAIEASPGKPLKLDDGACPGKPEQRLFLAAFDDEEHMIAWTEATLETAPGGTIHVALPVDKTAFYSISLDIAHLPEGHGHVGAFVANGTTRFWDSKEDNGKDSFKAVVNVPGTTTYDICVYGAADAGDAQSGSQTYRFWCQTEPTASWSFDAAKARWAYVSALDTTDAAHPVVTWSATPGKPADMITLDVSWSAGAATVTARVLLPADSATAWRLGDLPDDLLSFRPSDASIYGSVHLLYSAREDVADYADAVDGFDPNEYYSSGEWAYSWLNPVSVQ